MNFLPRKNILVRILDHSRTLFFASLALIATALAPAEVLVGYNIDNFPGMGSLPAAPYTLPTTAVPGSFTNPNFQTVALSSGPSFNPGANQVGFYRLNGTAGLPTTAVVSGYYLEFTLTPLPGRTFSLDATNSIQIQSRTYDTDNGSAGLFIRTSLDNFATTVAQVNGGDSTTRNFNLAGFTDLATAVTFRVYLFDTDGSANLAVRTLGTLGATGDLDFVINGSVTIGAHVPVAGVTVAPETANVFIGSTQQLVATLQPVIATEQGITWSSSNPAVATIDATGLVTPLTEGIAIMMATTAEGGFQDSAEITVQRVAVTGISVTPETATLDINGRVKLKATLSPTNPTYPGFTWSSSDPAVATVNESGRVTAVSTGSAIISATTADGGFADTCALTVTTNTAKGIGQVDAQGWTILTPSADSRLVYVSSSEGNDANDGLTPATAKATINAANALIRDGYPDWMLLKRGDTFGQPNLGRWKNGRSASEPLVLTYYGDAGPRPVIKLTGDFIEWNAQPRSNQAYVGLDLYRSISDPNSPDFTNTSGADAIRFNCGPNGDGYNVLVEDCRFRFCGLTIRGQQENPPFVHNAHVRRNIIMYNWIHNSETQRTIIQGLHCVSVMGLYVEENLLHHNGWSEDVPGALANMYNHNAYLQTNNGEEILVAGNIVSYGAAHGIQLRMGGIAKMNAFVGNAVSMNVGYDTPPEFYTGPTVIEDNVVTDGRPMIPNVIVEDQQTGAIWGLWTKNIANPVFNENIVANILDNRGGNMSPYSNMTATQFGTGNIGWNWHRENSPASDPGWFAPTRNAASFSSTHGWGDWNGFIAAAADRPLRTMPFDLTAYAYVNYIREGFNKAPVTVPYRYDPAIATITLGSLRQAYDGTPKSATATTTPAGLMVDFTYNGSSTVPTLPGTYAVVGVVDDPGHVGIANGEMVIVPTALVRHGPTLNSDVDGSVQVLSPENVTLNTGASISGDLLLPGSPVVVVNGNALHAGTQDGPGAVAPSTHVVTLNPGSVLRYVVRRVDATAVPVVTPPPAPTGTVNVALNNASQSVADWGAVRNLTLNGSAGLRAVPPGTYGNFSANGSSGFILGVVGATEPAVYNLQSLALNTLPGGSAQIQVVGPVILNLANGTVINGMVGSAAHPEWLTLKVATGGLTLSGSVTFNGDVVAPNGTVTLNGNSVLHGTVVADRLNVNGNALLNEPAPQE
jgi:hypothetical protein